MRSKTWVNAALFVLTIASAFFGGVSWAANYVFADRLAGGAEAFRWTELLADPRVVFLAGLYALCLMVILTGHELGHYLTCRRYGISATLPYFIPMPNMIGTLGAFIKIKSPIAGKKPLFDVGISGPLTGFVLSVPAVIAGLLLSRTVPALPREEAIIFGEPLLLKIVGLFVHVPAGFDLVLHPIAFAGWVGLLVSSCNLFPVGQLDGGHIAYALLGQRGRNLGRIIIPVFVLMGVFFWLGWLLWALLILLMGPRHPMIFDEGSDIGKSRKLLGVAALLIFVLSFIPDPVRGFDLFSVLKQLGIAVK